MLGKSTPIITSLFLKEATFEKTNVKIEPLTRVNFFYGGNGTGKSTIAKIIYEHDKNKVFFNDGKAAKDFDFLLFNQEFINKNFRSYEGIPGVLTINSTNIHLNDEMKQTKKEQEQVIAECDRLTKELNIKRAEMVTLDNCLINKMWDLTSEVRAGLKNALGTGIGKKVQFANNVKAYKTSKKIDFELLKRESDIAFNDDVTTYDELQTVSTTSIFDDINNLELLAKAIVGTSNSSFASFLDKLDALDWVKEGCKNYQELANNRCPYCQQKLPANFEDELSSCFDKQYKEDVEKLNQLSVTYAANCTKVLGLLKNNLICNYPDFKKNEYQKLIFGLETAVQLNRALIDKKCKRPSLIIRKDEWQYTDAMLEEINRFIFFENEKIKANNRIAENQRIAQDKCREEAWGYVRLLCDKTIKEYSEKSLKIEFEIDELTKEVQKQKIRRVDLENKIRELSKQGINVEQTIEEVNNLLREAGFQGFSLVTHKEGLGTYDVLRENGTIAHDLSEGERNFIAFLYFYQTVVGKGVFRKSIQAGQENSLEDSLIEKNKIVIIDDPASSLDSNSLFIISSLVRRLVNSCNGTHSNFKNQIGELNIESRFIEQIFVLTHNAYFHNDVTNGFVNSYRGVSFFVVRKRNNISSVKLCVRDSFEIGKKENFSPVRNSYASCWDELKYLYKTHGSAIEIKNVSRRILEQYFLHLCGYEGALLQEIVIEQINATSGLSGSLEAIVVDSLLRFIGCQETVFDEQTQLEDDGITVETHATAFKRIFEIMGQEQHYKMMMGN